ncbi:MAG: double-stranded uracil-DNA glycosylase [Actinomycetota bacterium]|nr:double-stranded uracil-DNA glycosylase [Actinomycetota bacterium]
MFVGSSVATASAWRGHYYAGRGNRFWNLLHEAGLTGDRVLVPEQDSSVLEYGLGLTDLVKGRAASSDSLLRRADYDVPAFISKVEEFKPRVVAFNGKESARRVFRFLGAPEPPWGPSATAVGGSRAFVLPSSSGASADRRNFLPKASKIEWWREFGAWLRAG